MVWGVAVAFLLSFVTLRAVEKKGEALRKAQSVGAHWGFQALDVVVPGKWGQGRQADGAEPQSVEVDDEGGSRQAILFPLASQGCAGQVHGDGLSRMSGCCSGHLGRRLDGTWRKGSFAELCTPGLCCMWEDCGLDSWRQCSAKRRPPLVWRAADGWETAA